VSFRIYFDEDTSSSKLVEALRERHHDVVTANEAGLREATDERQLTWAAENRRAIYTFNIADFCILHRSFLESGREHAGIILGHQQRYAVGVQLRLLLRLLNIRTEVEMQSQIEFLSNWG
jgi:hypothetical protein